MSDLISQLYGWFVVQLNTNQFFAGLIIPSAIAAVMYVFRSVPARIYHWLRLMLTLEFTITSKNNDYDDILKVLYNSRFSLFSRNYSISKDSKFLTPGYGNSIGRYKGKLFLFNRSIFEGKIDLQEETKITFLTRNLTYIDQFFKEATQKGNKELLDIFVQHNNYFNKSCSRPKRPLETVFVNDQIKENMVEKIQWFLDNEKWYLDRGITYKLCFCLHGLPGTGKSSLIFALASHFNLNIKLCKNLNQFDVLLTDEADDNYDSSTDVQENKINSVFVVEDIDCLNGATTRDSDTPSSTADQSAILTNNMVLHKILNALDGIGTPHGRIVFITTNKLGRLDPALTRKGRVDEIVHVDRLDSSQFISMFTSFYGQDKIKLAEQFVDQQYYRPEIGAVLSDLFLNNNAEIAIQILTQGYHQNATSTV